jgi:hypothetical protein
MEPPDRAGPTPLARRTLRIELLALDLSTCGRCRGTDAHLDEALRVAADRLRAHGVEAQVTRTVVTSEVDAVRHRFASSPTIRVDGRDIALEVRESPCDDCGELCGCDGGVSCRVWVWEGREHLEAPVPMIVEAVLASARGRAAPAPEAGPFRLPENLRTFFRERERRRAAAAGCCGDPADVPCCASAAARGR